MHIKADLHRKKYDDLTYFKTDRKILCIIRIPEKSLLKESKVEGSMKISYTIMCNNDVNLEIKLSEILANEKVAKMIKSEFAKGLRNLTLTSNDEASLYLKTEKEVYEFTVSKNDFADILVLAEEDARKHKRIKKECEGVELVDIVTLD